MGQNYVKILRYADEHKLKEEDGDNLQQILHTFGQIAEKYNMQISIEKTKTFSKQPLQYKLSLNNKSIEQVLDFSYLEVAVFSETNCISGSLHDIILKNKFMPQQARPISTK